MDTKNEMKLALIFPGDQRIKTLISLLLLFQLATACASGPGKAELDAEVKRLCAIDGGVKVYETVALPPEKFNRWGQVRIPSKQDAKIEDDYFYESSTSYLVTGNPEMWKSHYMVYRHLDGKLLGEATSYARRGGDLPGPWHESSFGCPRNADITDLNQKIFVKN